MRILIFSNGAWDDTTATGNTLSNLFSGDCWKNDRFFNIYMRDAMPNNNVCNIYYRITLVDMIKNFFNKEKIGKEIIISNDNQQIINNKKSTKERKIIDFIHKNSIKSIYTLADNIYRKKMWINGKFEKFIKNADPDIFYAHINNFAFLYPLVNYIKKNTHAKIVILLTDNLYEDINTKSIIRRKRLRKEYKNIIDSADVIYAITEELQKEYGKLFGKDIRILRKGCQFEYPVRNNINKVVKFVYAGNLLYGRNKMLSYIAKAIEMNNRTNETKAFLEIYTGDTITNELNKELNIDNCSMIMGKKEYKEIVKIENDADYVLHVESFDKKQIDYVKYSFSTKIIDCIQSGSCFVGIGPESIASIKYIEKIPGAHVIKSIESIQGEIIKLINNKNIIKESKKIREYAIKYHDKLDNQKKLRLSFENMK